MSSTTPTKQRPLGKNQEGVLEALKRHRVFYAGCGWTWDNYSTTVRILDSLVVRGLVTCRTFPLTEPGPRGTYTHVEYRAVES